MRHMTSAHSLASDGEATMLMLSASHTAKGSPASSAPTIEVTKYPKPPSCTRGVWSRIQCMPLTADTRATAARSALSIAACSLAILSTP